MLLPHPVACCRGAAAGRTQSPVARAAGLCPPRAPRPQLQGSGGETLMPLREHHPRRVSEVGNRSQQSLSRSLLMALNIQETHKVSGKRDITG